MVKMILGILSALAPGVGKLLDRWAEKSKEREKKKEIKKRSRLRRKKRDFIRRIQDEKDPEEQNRLIREFANRYGTHSLGKWL